MKDVLFLTLAEVIDIHSNQIRLYGGLPRIRDINLLSSAIAMPHASFHGEYLHNDIYEMAAAYAFHIGKNHPFVDGNKRTALVSALVFPELNGISISESLNRQARNRSFSNNCVPKLEFGNELRSELRSLINYAE